MARHTDAMRAQLEAEEWVSYPGGELEGRRPKALCPACREALRREAAGRSARRGGDGGADRRPAAARPLCFQCYRADLDRERALHAAATLDTASEARFQSQLPFEPIDRARLDRLKTARAEARTAAAHGIGQYVDKRRHAQIEARHALQRIAEGLKARRLAPAAAANTMDAAIHAAELQLPDAWLPFVVSR
jgi:hypothetical protein